MASWRSVVAGGLFFLAMLVLPLVTRASASESNGPRLVFAETTFDFGEVYEGEKVVYRFPFRNAGNEELRLDPIVVNEVHASCALPNALTVNVPSFTDADTVLVKPGAANEVVVALDTEGYAVKEFDGYLSQRIRIYSNDPNAPRTILQIKGRVKPVILRDPVEIQLGAVFKVNGQLPAELPSVHLIPVDGHQLKLEKIESNTEFLKPTFRPAPDGNGYLVTAAIDPLIPEGSFAGVQLTVHTNHPRKPTITIPVSGQVYSERPMSGSPEFIDFGMVRPGDALTAQVVMEKADGMLTIVDTSTKSDGPAVTAAVQRRSNGYDLTLSLKAPAGAWSHFSGEVTLTTDSKLQPKIVVPFVGWTYGTDAYSQPADRLTTFMISALGNVMFRNPDELLDKVLGGARDSRAVPLLIAMAKADGGIHERVRVIDFLERYPVAQTLEALEAIVRSKTEALVRDEALDIYYRVAPDRSLQLLIDSLDDESEWLREKAATLLGELGDIRAKAPLMKATHDPKPDVVIAAVESLEQFLAEPGEYDPAGR
jgi:hypothetical protein